MPAYSKSVDTENVPSDYETWNSYVEKSMMYADALEREIVRIYNEKGGGDECIQAVAKYLGSGDE